MTWVHDDERGRGIGAEAILAFENTAKSRGVDHVFVTSFTFQAPEFYQRLGYQEIFRWDGIPVPGHDDVHMRKSLDDTDHLSRSPANARRLSRAMAGLRSHPEGRAAVGATTQTATTSGHSHALLRKACLADADGILSLWTELFEGEDEQAGTWERHARRWFTKSVDEQNEAFFPILECGGEIVANAVAPLRSAYRIRSVLAGVSFASPTSSPGKPTGTAVMAQPSSKPSWRGRMKSAPTESTSAQRLTASACTKRPASR